ncbi:MAG: hypothetical protein ACI9KS_002854, partial [Sulfitobacter sp.]
RGVNAQNKFAIGLMHQRAMSACLYANVLFKISGPAI